MAAGSSSVVQSFCAGRILAVALAMLLASTVWAADWPQYRGPAQDGTSPETGLLKSWPPSGPKLVWKVPVGESFGSFSVSGGKALLFAERGGSEVCFAYDAATGKELWATPIDKTIFEKEGGNGPRSTPTIDGQRIYIFGTYLKLACLNLEGNILWSHDLVKEFTGQGKTSGIRQWGCAASPIVEGNMLIVQGGGPNQSFIAFDKVSGDVVWRSQAEKITHATATVATLAGVRQLIFFTQSGLVSVAAENGNFLWRYRFPFSVSTAASPVVGGDVVYCSAGYGVGGGAVRVGRNASEWQVTELWRTPGENISHWATPVYKDGHLYGIYGFKQFGTAPLRCIEIGTGKEKWSRGGFGPGGTILVDGNLLVTSDRGELVMVEATPTAYHELARTQAVAGKTWTMPVISNGHVFVRSVKEAACFDISGK